TSWGTLVGLAALSTLQNGLRLAALPSELTGVITSVLLVGTIALGRLVAARPARAAEDEPKLATPKLEGVAEERRRVKNSQVAVICATILAAAFLVAGPDGWLGRSGGSRGAGARPAVAVSAQGESE